MNDRDPYEPAWHVDFFYSRAGAERFARLHAKQHDPITGNVQDYFRLRWQPHTSRVTQRVRRTA